MRNFHPDYIAEIDGPQSFVSAGGRKILCKGDGGGGGSTYYGNMDRLYGVQSNAAQYMLDNSMQYLPQYTQNSSQMVSDAMDGALSNKMRQQAGNESTATMGAALDASNRNMQRYGMGFSADRLLSESNKNAIMGAASKAGAMNNAASAAEDKKWNMNAGALGQVTGMGTGSMQSLGSAAGGYGAAAGNMNYYDAQNASGYGRFGAAVASNAFKDGGSVRRNPSLAMAGTRYAKGGAVKKCGTKAGLHMAVGGGVPSSNPWVAFQNNNPIQTSQQSSGGSSGLGNALGSAALGAAPIVIGKGLKAGLSAVKGAATTQPAAEAAGVAGERAGGALANGAEIGMSSAAPPEAATMAATTPAAEAAGTTLADAGTAALADAGTAAATDAVTTAGTTAAADAAATAGAAAVGEAAAAGSVAGPVGTAAGLAAGALMASGALDDVFANGGGVKRKNMNPGGKVTGAGTETSDSVPAWLSVDEHVQNATSAKLIGLNTLDAINNEGLKVREGKTSAAAAKKKIGEILDKRGDELAGDDDKPGLHMALGGNVGIALGAAADEWNRQKQLGMAQSLTDLRLKLAKPQLDTLDEQADSLRGTYNLNTARQKAGLDMLPTQTANTRKQQQIQGIGLDNTLTGYVGQSLLDDNKERGIQIMNDSLAAMPGYNGVKFVDAQPAKDGSGVNYIMSDNSTKFIPAAELKRAIGAMKQGDYQFIHDTAGNVYSGNKSTGAVSQQVKGDPSQFIKQHAPTQELLAQSWVSSGYAKDMKDAYQKMNTVKGKSFDDFALDYVKQNAGMGKSNEQLVQDARQAFILINPGKTEQPAATAPAPSGKSGTNWQEWVAPPQ